MILICEYCKQQKDRSLMNGGLVDPREHECFSQLLIIEIDALKREIQSLHEDIAGEDI